MTKSIYYKGSKEVINQNITQLEQLLQPESPPKFVLGQWIDIKETRGDWLEAQVIDIEADKIKVRYYLWQENNDEWLPTNSDRIDVLRSHTVQHANATFQSPYPALAVSQRMTETSMENLLQRFRICYIYTDSICKQGCE